MIDSLPGRGVGCGNREEGTAGRNVSQQACESHSVQRPERDVDEGVRQSEEIPIVAAMREQVARAVAAGVLRTLFGGRLGTFGKLARVGLMLYPVVRGVQAAQRPSVERHY